MRHLEVSFHRLIFLFVARNRFSTLLVVGFVVMAGSWSWLVFRKSREARVSEIALVR